MAMFKSKPEAYIFVKDALISECLQLLQLEMQIIAAQCRERPMGYDARFNFFPFFRVLFSWACVFCKSCVFHIPRGFDYL